MFSIGGGTLANEHFNEQTERKVYEMSHISDILQWCDSTGYSFWEYVEQCEGKEIIEYLREVWDTMQKAVERGLNAEGVMPGGLAAPQSPHLLRAFRRNVGQHEKPRTHLCLRPCRI